MYDDLEESLSKYGFAVVRRTFATDEIATLHEECHRLWRETTSLSPFNLRTGLRKDESGDFILERLDPVSDISPLFRELVADRRLSEPAESGLGGPVTPVKDKLIYKWPGCQGYGVHRDDGYFGVSGIPGHETISVSLAIDPANENNGSIQLYPALRNQLLPSSPDNPRDVDPAALEGISPLTPALDPGDILVFDGLVPHGSQPNRSEQTRIIFTVTYAPGKYAGCFEKYYQARWKEQIAERNKHFPGTFYFE